MGMICKLIDIAEFNPTESLKKGTVAKKVAMEQLRPFCRDISNYTLEPFNGGTKFRNGDTIMARITPCLENGKTAKVNILDDDEIGFGSTEYIVFRAKEGICDEDYLYYLICSPIVRDIAIKSMVGSTGRQRVQIDVVQNIEIDLPDISEQKKIGALLRSLDDKIELNNKINKNLEQQAQVIYRERYETATKNMPSSWRVVTLGEVATITNKIFNPLKEPNKIIEYYSIPAFDEAKFPIFELSSSIKSNKFVVDSSCLMISKLNPTTKRVWKPYCLTDIAVCSTEFIVYKAKDEAMTDFLFSVIDSNTFYNFMCSHVTGSTGSRQRTTPSETLNFEFILPLDKDLSEFCSLVSPIYEQVSINAIENDKLKRLHDTLIQKLMSGVIEVNGF